MLVPWVLALTCEEEPEEAPSTAPSTRSLPFLTARWALATARPPHRM
jgi:hypothetical protein